MVRLPVALGLEDHLVGFATLQRPHVGMELNVRITGPGIAGLDVKVGGVAARKSRSGHRRGAVVAAGVEVKAPVVGAVVKLSVADQVSCRAGVSAAAARAGGFGAFVAKA